MADTQPAQPTQNLSLGDLAAQPTADKIRVKVRNRTRILFDDYVTSLTSKNDTGIFDVLPEHSNFISLITSPLILRPIDGQEQKIEFNNGIIKVKNSEIHCYVDLLSK